MDRIPGAPSTAAAYHPNPFTDQTHAIRHFPQAAHLLSCYTPDRQKAVNRHGPEGESA